MTVEISKDCRKNEFIRILNLQKQYFEHYFREEEALNLLFDRLVEIMFTLENNALESSFEKKKIFKRIDNQIREVKGRAMRTIMFHKGSLL